MNRENRKKTIGEELWLVYLKRYHPTPEDVDLPERRTKRKKTIGQELYEVHLKRCQGLSCDCDYDYDKNEVIHCKNSSSNSNVEPKYDQSTVLNGPIYDNVVVSNHGSSRVEPEPKNVQDKIGHDQNAVSVSP